MDFRSYSVPCHYTCSVIIEILVQSPRTCLERLLFFPHTTCDLFQIFRTEDSEREWMLCRCFHTYSGSELEKGNAVQCRKGLLNTGTVQCTPLFQPAPILLHRSSNASREQEHTGPQGGTTACSLTILHLPAWKKNYTMWTFWERAFKSPGYKFAH